MSTQNSNFTTGKKFLAVCVLLFLIINPAAIIKANTNNDILWHSKITAPGDTTLPVELTDFVATTIKNEVILDWATGGELNNDKFEIERVDITNFDNYNPKDLIYKKIGALKGNGTSQQIHYYRFIDRNLNTGKYLYRLKQIDFNSNFIYHILFEEVIIDAPAKFIISQNYPNPFNPYTKINFELPADGFVTLAVFDINGKEIKKLINENKTAGYYTISFNASEFSSGVYYYRINFVDNANVNSVIKKMMVLK